jgi:hypothetical protein
MDFKTHSKKLNLTHSKGNQKKRHFVELLLSNWAITDESIYTKYKKDSSVC